MRKLSLFQAPLLLASLAALPAGILAGDILSSNGYTTCFDNPHVRVNALDIKFDRITKKVTFDVSGTNEIPFQNITAELVAVAYGRQVYQRSFSPCDAETYVKQLCPVPVGTFAAKGEQTIPDEYISQIPSIAFAIPDLDGSARLTVRSSNGTELACVQSAVGNGRTMNAPVVSYVAAGVLGSTLVLSGLGAVAGAGAAPGGAAGGPSPNFGQMVGWFQTLATSGMLSVNYPPVYRSFSQNFAFATGVIPWGRMQNVIDSFRGATGGNLTENNYEYLRAVTVVPTTNGTGSASKLLRRDLTATLNGQTATVGNASSSTADSSSESQQMHYVHGIQAYVEQLKVPQSNVFMTVLMYFTAVIAAITVLILLGKLILETVAMCGKLPHSLESWRQRYWWRLAKTITSLIFALYGIFTLWCIYQFTIGDSWVAKALAGVTLGLFTGVLVAFTWSIVWRARRFKELDGDTSGLFEDKETWIKYSLFYDSFKREYWWTFIVFIVFAFARNAVIAIANGHGMVQVVGGIIVEGLLLVLVVWVRPYQLRSGNVINIVIQAVRLASVVCILVFVEELGISQTTQTMTGLALIIVQAVLTGVLAILLAVDAIMACVKENPHRRQRKEQEKMMQQQQQDIDDGLAPSDSRRSLLIDTHETEGYRDPGPRFAVAKNGFLSPRLPQLGPTSGYYQQVSMGERRDSRDNLVLNAAGMAGRERW